MNKSSAEQYNEMVDELTRIQEVNRELVEALQGMIKYVDGLGTMPCISAAMKAVGRAQAALARAGVKR